MTPVDQTTFAGFVPDGDAKGAGNCIQAAWASLLNLTLDDVPHFAAMADDEWWTSMLEWLLSRGYCLVLAQSPLAAIGITSGRSPRGDFKHVVITSGNDLVHDPHPSRDGVIDPDEWWYLVPLDPAQCAQCAA